MLFENIFYFFLINKGYRGIIGIPREIIPQIEDKIPHEIWHEILLK